MPPVVFEPTNSAGEPPQTYALDRAATGTGLLLNIFSIKSMTFVSSFTVLINLSKHAVYVNYS